MTFDPCEDCGGLVRDWLPILFVCGLWSVPLVISILRRQGVMAVGTAERLGPLQRAFAVLAALASIVFLRAWWL